MMKKLFVTLLAAACLFAAADDMAEKVRQQNMEVVKHAAKSLSEELPKRVDQYTQLVAIDADGEKLVYTFQVDAGPKSDEQLIAEGKERMTRNVTRGLCQSSERFLKSGITIVYRYVSAATKKPLFDVVVSQKDCPMLKD